MTINEKLNQLKNTVEEIKNITSRLEDSNVYKSKINDLNKDIIRLKKGINESIDDLEEFLGNKDA
jgi:archaellum component FlaC